MAHLHTVTTGHSPIRRQNFDDVFEFAPRAVHHYLAHTGAGISIRDLARRLDCHASTVLRRIRRVEQSRDDPLVDAALRRMEQKVGSHLSCYLHRFDRECVEMNGHSTHDGTTPLDPKFEQEAMRVLRRLCETGAVLAIAEDMDMAVVVREGPDGGVTRTAVVSQEVAQAIALQGWIEATRQSRVMRYSITASGREQVKEMLGRQVVTEQPGAVGFAEASAGFDRPTGVARISAVGDDADTRKYRYNLAESPLVALSRRRDRDGLPFLSDDLVRCGERLREDFELAQMGIQASPDWTSLLASRDTAQPSVQSVKGYGPDAARARVITALRDLGPGLSDVALRCCCYLEGLESTEKQMGWSARSGKIVLRIALQRLKRHYAETLTAESQMIG